MFLPQGLCAGCVLCLPWTPPPPHPRAQILSLFIYLLFLLRCPLLRDHAVYNSGPWLSPFSLLILLSIKAFTTTWYYIHFFASLPRNLEVCSQDAVYNVGKDLCMRMFSVEKICKEAKSLAIGKWIEWQHVSIWCSIQLLQMTFASRMKDSALHIFLLAR